MFIDISIVMTLTWESTEKTKHDLHRFPWVVDPNILYRDRSKIPIIIYQIVRQATSFGLVFVLEQVSGMHGVKLAPSTHMQHKNTKLSLAVFICLARPFPCFFHVLHKLPNCVL